MDSSKNSKEKILVSMEVFSKFSVLLVKRDQTAKPVTKALVNRCFCTYGIPSRIHNNKGKIFDNSLIVQLYMFYSIEQFTTTPYTLMKIHYARVLIEHCMTY